MIALRCVSLILAFWVVTAPAVARIDDRTLGERERIATAQQQAVIDVLDAATDSGDPIEKIVLDGVWQFYERRDFDLLWLRNGAASNQMLELRDLMNAAAEDGLDAAAYETPDFAAAYALDPATLAQADVEFSRCVARYVTHLGSGRIRPTDISKLITLEPARPDIGEALQRLSHAVDVAADVASFAPPHPEYQALKAALATLRAAPS
jgi:murein L,D-transpeptidase YcbB/YkuD